MASPPTDAASRAVPVDEVAWVAQDRAVTADVVAGPMDMWALDTYGVDHEFFGYGADLLAEYPQAVGENRQFLIEDAATRADYVEAAWGRLGVPGCGMVLQPWEKPQWEGNLASVVARLEDVPDEVLLDPDVMAALDDPDSLWVTSFVRANNRIARLPSEFDYGMRRGPRPEWATREHLRAAAVEQVLANWQYGATSSDALDEDDMDLDLATIVPLQNAARGMFEPEVEDAPWAERQARAVLLAQYGVTQDYLAARGIGEVTMHRGMGWTGDRTPEWVPSQGEGSRTVSAEQVGSAPLTAFSLRQEVASTFTGFFGSNSHAAVLHGTVPASRVISYMGSGFGALSAAEVVVLDGPGEWTAQWHPNTAQMARVGG